MMTIRIAILLFIAGAAALPISAANRQQKNKSNSGQPWKRHTIDNASRGADGARLMDVNGDGLPDVATGWEEGGQVRICLHPGIAKVRKKWPSVMVGKVKAPEDAVFADLDNDGAVDVISCCEGRNNQVYVHWAPRDKSRYLDEKAWKTDSFPQVKDMSQWMFCEPMQIDGQHGIDLVVGSKNKNGQIGWLQAPANPRDLSAWTYHKLTNAGWIMTLMAADMDDDGDKDVLVSDRRKKSSGCLWLENPGVNADQTTQVQFPKGAGGGKAVRVADVNLDGKLDIILALERATKGNGIVWLSYQKSVYDVTWDAHQISGLAGIKFDLIPLADLDGDGDLDVINTEERTGSGGLGVVWYENPTK